MAVKGWIQVDERFCKGCELCVHFCPQQVLGLASDRLTLKGYHPAQLLDPERCTGCEVCAVVCPEGAITVYRQVRPRVPEMVVQG
ncbi:4Fe-4S dicluster domain-containing protein [Thermoflexus hugenholtzii]